MGKTLTVEKEVLVYLKIYTTLWYKLESLLLITGQVLKVEADDAAAEENIKSRASRTWHEIIKLPNQVD